MHLQRNTAGDGGRPHREKGTESTWVELKAKIHHGPSRLGYKYKETALTSNELTLGENSEWHRDRAMASDPFQMIVSSALETPPKWPELGPPSIRFLVSRPLMTAQIMGPKEKQPTLDAADVNGISNSNIGKLVDASPEK
jgi:hypothetical protein